MIRQELKKLPVGSRELRKFGWTVGGVFVLLALWFGWRHKPFYPYFLVPAVPLLVLGWLVPRSLKAFYLGWMGLALVLGMVVSTVLLTLFFYLVVTPIGLLARMVGKDFLNRRWDSQTPSYWIRRAPEPPKTKAEYEQQF
jgi:hypothetical protein